MTLFCNDIAVALHAPLVLPTLPRRLFGQLQGLD